MPNNTDNSSTTDTSNSSGSASTSNGSGSASVKVSKAKQAKQAAKQAAAAKKAAVATATDKKEAADTAADEAFVKVEDAAVETVTAKIQVAQADVEVAQADVEVAQATIESIVIPSVASEEAKGQSFEDAFKIVEKRHQEKAKAEWLLMENKQKAEYQKVKEVKIEQAKEVKTKVFENLDKQIEDIKNRELPFSCNCTYVKEKKGLPEIVAKYHDGSVGTYGTFHR